MIPGMYRSIFRAMTQTPPTYRIGNVLQIATHVRPLLTTLDKASYSISPLDPLNLKRPVTSSAQIIPFGSKPPK